MNDIREYTAYITFTMYPMNVKNIEKYKFIAFMMSSPNKGFRPCIRLLSPREVQILTTFNKNPDVALTMPAEWDHNDLIKYLQIIIPSVQYVSKGNLYINDDFSMPEMLETYDKNLINVSNFANSELLVLDEYVNYMECASILNPGIYIHVKEIDINDEEYNLSLGYKLGD